VQLFLRSVAWSVFLSCPGGLAAQTPVAARGPLARSAAGEKLKYAGLPKFGKVNDSLYRGGQPHAEGFQQLKRLGITTIIDLRGEAPGTIAWERQQAEALGIRFLHLPVSGWSTPRDEQVAQFFSFVRSRPSERVFVHCRFGEDRTGVLIASYRIALEHWSADQAVNEMLAFGFHRRWHPQMAGYVRSLPDRLQENALLQSSLSPPLAPLLPLVR
jgi:tyrosine-protein phosphatase SIW14